MIVNFGLSDVASDEDHYPVRRRGEKRRLNPNRAGIAWLDGQAAVQSVPTIAQWCYDDKSTWWQGITAGEPWIKVWRATGFRGGNTPRPMLQAFRVDKIGRGMRSNGTCCPDCYDFAYSDSRCDRGHKPAQGRSRSSALHISLQALLPELPPITDSLRRDLAAWAASYDFTVAPEFEEES